MTNIMRKRKHKIYFDITNYNVNTGQKINTEQINGQPIFELFFCKKNTS